MSQSHAVAMLTRHQCQDSRLGPVVAVHGASWTVSAELRLLGFSCRKVSGKRERGGPGHRVSHAWVVPQTRWDSDPLLRAAVDLLFKRNNGARLSELAAATENYQQLLAAVH